jgi:RNA polymerase sigma factor (sigma-70 family)
MTERENLAARFEASRDHLRSVAYRMLGSRGEADDAVQEAWLRLARADSGEPENLRAWLTTVVARVCLDMLRSRKARREAPLTDAAETATGDETGRTIEVADSIGLAMMIVLETLSPAERVAFVLHDMFNLPFDDIAPLVRRSSAAARQLASRARRRVQGTPATVEADRARQREIVSAFLAASRGGDLSALIAILDPDVVLRADSAAINAGFARLGDTPMLAPELHGREAVAHIFKGRAKMAQPGTVDGEPGLVIVLGGMVRTVFGFLVEDGKILEIELIADPATVETMLLDF